MTAPDRIGPPRQAAAWGLVVIGLLVAVAVGVLVVRRASGALDRVGRPAEPVVTHQVVVQQLREVAKLVASEMTLRDVVIFEQERMLSRKRVLLVATGRISAGIDIGAGGADVRIDSIGRRIRIALQPARILSIEVIDVKTYDERAGLWNPFTPADRDQIQRRIRTQLDIAARQAGILRHADESAARLLVTLLARDGYTVEITRPLVIQKPAG